MTKELQSARWLGKKFHSLESKVRDVSRAQSLPQLANSSIESGGIEEYDTDGTLTSVTGEQFDGTHTSSSLAGPVPPEPSAPSVKRGMGSAEVRWNGKFADGAMSPMDFLHVAVHVSELSAFSPDNDTQRATISGESGDVATIILEPGEWSFALVAVSKSGKWSDMSDVVTVELAEPLSEILDSFIGVDEKLNQIDTSLAAIQTSVDGKSKIYNSVIDADTTVPYMEGDRWQKWSTLSTGGQLLASWRYTASAWVAESMAPSYLPKIDIGQGTFGALNGGRMEVGTLQANTLVVRDTTNLFPDPMFRLGLAWLTGTTGWVADPTLNSGLGAMVYKNAGTATVYAAQLPGNGIQVQGGEQYLVTADVAVTAGTTPNVHMRVWCYNKDNANTNIIAGKAFTTANGTYTTIGGVITVPAGTVRINPVATFYTPVGAGENLYVTNVRVCRAATGELIVDGAITTRKLEAELVLATDIVAGNPAGSHSRMTPTGFRVRANPDGGVPADVIRMGTDTDDYFGVVNTGGQLVASITSGGDISGQGGDFSTDINLAGSSLLETIDALPKGLIAWASRGSDQKYWAGSGNHPYLHLSFDVVGGRSYRVSTSPIQTVAGGVGSYPVVMMHYAASTRATTSSPVISYGDYYQSSDQLTKSPVTFNRLITPGATGPNAILISCATRAGLGKITAGSGVSPVTITIEDMGPAMAQTGEQLDGSADATTANPAPPNPPPPPVVKNYDRIWDATGTRSFIGSGATYAFNQQYMYSGLSPAGYGDLSSMAVFPNLTGELSGATISGIWIYVYYDFWYQGSGGTPYVGLHGQTGLTSTRPARTWGPGGLGNWPRASGKWVTLASSTYAGFKSGQHRGITLGDSGGGYERYGYARNPRIRIKYTK